MHSFAWLIAIMSILSLHSSGRDKKKRKNAYVLVSFRADLEEDCSVWESRKGDSLLSLGGTDASWSMLRPSKPGWSSPVTLLWLLLNQEIGQATKMGHNRKTFAIIENFEGQHPQTKQKAEGDAIPAPLISHTQLGTSRTLVVKSHECSKKPVVQTHILCTFSPEHFWSSSWKLEILDREKN